MILVPSHNGEGLTFSLSAGKDFFLKRGSFPDGSLPPVGLCAHCAGMKLGQLYPDSPSRGVQSELKEAKPQSAGLASLERAAAGAQKG